MFSKSGAKLLFGIFLFLALFMLISAIIVYAIAALSDTIHDRNHYVIYAAIFVGVSIVFGFAARLFYVKSKKLL